jgi:hypothetical protein
VDILQCLKDPLVFGPAFRKPESWRAWVAYLASLFALPLTPEQLEIYQKHTGRIDPPSTPSREAYLVCGRRAGKSFIMSLTAVFLATSRDYRQYLQRGERATVMIIAADRRQARIILRYVAGLLYGSPMLKKLIERETSDTFDLRGQVTIEIATASSKTTRGYALIAAIADEASHWATSIDAAENDVAIINALKPALRQIPGSLLLIASSPYARKGVLWEGYNRFYGVEGAPLVWQASSTAMNPSLNAEEIQAEIDADPAVGAAEYLGQFRVDVEMLLTREVVLAAVSQGVYERPPEPHHRYVAFLDPSGGSVDSMALAVGHLEGADVLIDALRDLKPPFSPEAVTAEFAALMKSYRVTSVTSDRYAGAWVAERLRTHGMAHDVSKLSASELFVALVPALNGGRVQLLDNVGLLNQLVALERRNTVSSKPSVGHPRNGHDDASVCIAGVCHALLGREPAPVASITSLAAAMGYGRSRRALRR